MGIREAHDPNQEVAARIRSDQILSWTFLAVPGKINELIATIPAEYVDSLKGFLLSAINNPASSFHNFGGKRCKKERG